MTTYNAASVSDAVIAFQKGITLQQGRALRDNPKAVWEGDPSAPGISGLGMARPGHGLATATITAADTYQILYGTVATTTTLSTSSTTEVVASTYVMSCYTGTARFRCQHYTNDSAHTATLKLYKNGTLVATFTTVSTTPVEKTSDVTFVAGDAVQWRHYIDSGAFVSTASPSSITANDAYTPVYPLALVSQL